MADPTGTSGTPQVDRDFGIVAKGGASFMARLQQLVNAHDAAETALAQLRLGQEADAALKEAAGQRDAANVDRAAAAAELANAKRDAAKILADAEAQRSAARELRGNAEARLRDVEEQMRAAKQREWHANEALDTARAAETKFNGKIARLQAALSELK